MSTAAPLLTPKQAGGRLGVSVNTLKLWRSNGEGPNWTRVGPKLVRYSEESIADYLTEQEKKSA